MKHFELTALTFLIALLFACGETDETGELIRNAALDENH